ncbi:unnamed protein product [Gongylonema pulchrum]|uniref:Uncharacterized protein n=1 Tax=Gongylonema pulchrum TaxID=637853 RepID=A0A3P6QU17_9BILA|nr:unnamed protein product [Gongylonema pulchrum]
MPVGFEPKRLGMHERHVDLSDADLASKAPSTAAKMKEEMPTSQLPSAEEMH